MGGPENPNTEGASARNSRIGGAPQGGGFLKDIIYLKGLVELRDYLGNGGALQPLLAGKFALKHVDIINDLTQRKLLNAPKIIPRYFENTNFSTKLNAFKEGITLSKMI